jgi:hypothetical protein
MRERLLQFEGARDLVALPRPAARSGSGASRSQRGGSAFLPEPHTDFALTASREHRDGGVTVIFQTPRSPEADAGAPPPMAEALPLLSAEAVLPDGSVTPLVHDGVTTVAPSARFRVEVLARLADARLSLLDAQDAMVAGDDTVEATATTRFTLAPTAPLRPGSSYTLRLEGAEGRLLRAEDGGAYEPVSLAMRTPGAAPARKAKRRRGR